MKLSRLALIILLSIALLFIRLGGTSVFQVAEARNSECAREMMQSDNKITPTFNGELRTDKPALEYYAMMAAYYLFGVSEGSARFFSAVCGLILIIATFLFVRKHVSAGAAWWSAFVLLSSMHTIVQFRLATPDPYLILFHVLSLYCFWEGFTSRRFGWYALMYVLLGLGFFAKGPVGIVLPALTILLQLLFTRQFTLKNIVRLQPWWGIFIMAAVAFPWYYLVHVKTGGAWTEGFFLQHNVGRFDEAVGSHSGPFILTFLFVILGMFPFSVFFIRVGRFAWQKRKENHLLLFCFIAFWCVVGFYFFSSTRLINYTAPAYPFLAILTGVWLNEKLPLLSFKAIKPEVLIICTLTLLMPAGIYIWAINTEPVNELSWIAFPLLILSVGSLAAFRFAKQNTAKSLLSIGYTYMAATVLVFIWLFPAVDDLTAMKKHKNVVESSQHIAAYKKMNDAFVFYSRNRIPILNTRDSVAQYLALYNDALIIGNERKDMLPHDSLPSITLYSKDRDLFSLKYSFIYTKR